MSIVFGVEILLDDRDDPAAQDTDIGLYAVNSDLASDAAADQKDVIVDDGSVFSIGEVVVVKDDNASEEAVIDSISSNTLTMLNNLTNAYATADNAAVVADSRFRWIQNSITGLTGWKHGMLVDGGISPWRRGFDEQEVARGGCAETPGKGMVSVTNGARFHADLETAGIYLHGCRAHIYEFDGTTRYRAWTAVVDCPAWDAYRYIIPLRGFTNKRNTNILTLIDATAYPDADDKIIGAAIPALFGEHRSAFDSASNPDYYAYARFVRTANKVTQFDTDIKIYSGARVIAEAYIFNVTGGTPLQLNVYDSRSIGQRYYPVIMPGNVPALLPTRLFDLQLVADEDTTFVWTEDGVTITTGTYTLGALAGKYLHIVDGAGSGQYRKITQAQVIFSVNSRSIRITVAEYFAVHPHGNATADEDSNSWAEIVDIAGGYHCDEWPCASYIDEDGTAISKGVPLYAYTSVKTAKVTTENTDARVTEEVPDFTRLPEYAYDDATSGGHKNEIEVNAKGYDQNLGSIRHVVNIPAASVAYLNEANLLKYDDIPNVRETDKPGSYPRTLIAGTMAYVSGSMANLIDRDPDTYLEVQLNAYNSVPDNAFFLGLVVTKPNIPDRLIFDTAHMLIKATFSDKCFRAKTYHMRFKGDGVICLSQSLADDGAATVDGHHDDYWSSDTSNYGRYHWWEHDSEAGDADVSGIDNFTLTDIDTVDKYRAIMQCVVLLGCYDDYEYGLSTIKVYQVSFAFKRLLDIGDNVFAPMKGRTIGGPNSATWSGRKTAATMLESPLDILEHINRLQQWGDTSNAPTLGWGHDYADGARINITKATVTSASSTSVEVASGYGKLFRARQRLIISDGTNRERDLVVSSVSGDTITLTAALANTYSSGSVWAEGSFDDPEVVAALGGLKLARQVIDYEDGWTEGLKRTLCQDIGLLSWTDRDGYECVSYTDKNTRVPTVTITLDDIIDRQSIRVVEPRPSDLFPEPFVRYQLNTATDEPQKAITVKNVENTTYDASYVNGLETADAEDYWTLCRTLYRRAKEVQRPPEDYTEMKWANGPNGDDVAQDAFKRRVLWSFNPLLYFRTHYTTARYWELGMPLYVNFPHATGGVAVEALIVALEVNPNPPYDVAVTAILLRDADALDSDVYRDTLVAYGDSRDWVDTFTVYGDDDDKTDTL